MSAPPAAPRSSPRPTPATAPAVVVRGAPAEALEQPAGVFLGRLAWEGPSPDPETLDAATFLAWL